MVSLFRGRTRPPLKIVIVGNGVAGITCARVARQRDPKAVITVISGETDYFFSRTALMYSFMDRLTRRDLEPHERSSYRKQRIDLIRDWVVDLDADTRTVYLQGGSTLQYDKLVFAVGARPREGAWDGLDSVRDGLVNFVSMQDLDQCERLAPSTREAVVVGGGLIGIELVECLWWHKKRVTFVVREPYYWPVALAREEAEFVTEHMRHHGVEVRFGEELVRIETDSAGRVSGLLTKSGDRLACQMLGVCIGVQPNIDRMREFKTQPAMDRGIIVNELFETSLPEVYAAGDCAEFRMSDGRPPFVELIWYTAKRHGEIVGRNLFGDKVAYTPIVFYNSSKFFEIEYSTVGQVMSLPEGTPTIYRRMPGKGISQRIVHDGERVLGFNMLGSRWNHELLQRWILEHRSPEFALSNLASAQFDVEFGRVGLDRMEESELPLQKREHRK
jgi:NADPH-dependent 2,4-dienoyl-CoA reductase/sulfur reductase-like enzyme